DRVLVRVRAAEREENPTPGKPGFLQEQLGEPGTRLRAPRVGHEAQPLRLLANRLDDARVLVTEVAALREAAHVENQTIIGRAQMGSGAAHDRGRVPLCLSAPAVQDCLVFRAHGVLRQRQRPSRSVGDIGRAALYFPTPLETQHSRISPWRTVTTPRLLCASTASASPQADAPLIRS